MSLSADDSRDEKRSTPLQAPSDVVRDLDEKEEVDLSSLLDLQDKRVEVDSKRTTRVILKVCGSLVILMLIVLAVSSAARREVSGLIENVKESRQQVDAESTNRELSKAYDEIMVKLGSRSTEIDSATRRLGGGSIDR